MLFQILAVDCYLSHFVAVLLILTCLDPHGFLVHDGLVNGHNAREVVWHVRLFEVADVVGGQTDIE